jgi:hypothetical protein
VSKVEDRLEISKKKIIELNNKFNDSEFKNIYLDYFIILVTNINFLSNNKKIFKRNEEIANFLDNIFHIGFKDYIKKNRKLIIGATMQFISSQEERENYEAYANELNRGINRIIKDQTDPNYVDYLKKAKE